MAPSSSSEMAAPAAEAKLPAAAITGDVALAAAGSESEGFGYVGVWAKDAAGCASIGSPSESDFAVITYSTFRNGPTLCFGGFKAAADGKTTLAMGCNGTRQSVDVAQSSPDAITLNGTEMVRCKP